MLIKWIGPSPSFNSDSWIGEVSGAGTDEYFRVYKLKGSQTYRLRLSLGYVVKSWGFLAKHDAFAQAERIARALFGPTAQHEFMAGVSEIRHLEKELEERDPPPKTLPTPNDMLGLYKRKQEDK